MLPKDWHAMCVLPAAVLTRHHAVAIAVCTIMATPLARAGDSGITPASSLPIPRAAACVVGTQPPELAAWAGYVAASTCDALRKRGALVGMPAPTAIGAPAAFTITLDRLGPTFTLLVTYEAPLGTTRRALWAPMNDLREVDRVVARFVTELTTRAQPVVYPPPRTIPSAPTWKEPRKPKPPERPKKGNWYIGPEAGWVAFPASSKDSIGQIIGAFLSVETGHWGFSLRGVAGFGFVGSKGSKMSAISLGARYYFGGGTASMFVGSGPATSLSVTEHAGTDFLTYTGSCFILCFGSDTSMPGKLEREGAGAFVEAGFTWRRLLKFPNALTFRADFPFDSLTRSKPDSPYSSPNYTLTRTGPTTVYEVPLSITYSIGF